LAESPEEIASRQTVEGGTGLYESIEEKLSIDTKASALDYTNGLLRRYAAIQTAVTFDTFTKYEAGQLVDVTLTSHGINEQMLVSNVSITDLGATNGSLMYGVKLGSGESVGGWINFFKKIAEKNTTYTIRENEVLVKLVTFQDNYSALSLEDTMTYHLHQYHICGQTICGTEVIL
jgi:hypothetical protein